MQAAGAKNPGGLIPAAPSAKKDLFERIVGVYPVLSSKKRKVADFIIRDYKKVFFMTAKEIALECRVSEPTVMRLTNALGFSGYQEFVKYLKGLLHIELTGVERLLKTRDDEEVAILHRYCRNAIRNLQNLMDSVSEKDLRRLAEMVHKADRVYVVGYRASAVLAYYFGYTLKKLRSDVFLDVTLSWELKDLIAKENGNGVLFAIAFPRYPRKVIELLQYAKKCGLKIIGVSDTPGSPIIPLSDEYVLIDMEGVSFIDPFAHVIAFLGALLHEITFLDSALATGNLAAFDEGVKHFGEFFGEESTEPKTELKPSESYLVSLWPDRNRG
jgi:DNA-binding MurR/RpiR family transcriptional regulator